MDAYTNQSPLTLPVRDLSRATSFYLSTLDSLGYCVISRVHHRAVAANFPGSDAVGLGPDGTSRVDLFLSRSESSPQSTPTPAHVVFPAPSRAAVREVYTAAVRAGASVVTRPADEPDGIFAASVADPDGNTIEVGFSDPTHVPDQSQDGHAIQRWREDVASSSGSTVSHRTAVPASEAASSATIDKPRRASMAAASHQPSVVSRPRASSPESKSASNNYTNAVIGTAIGAATGAALAYGMLKSKNDSVSKDRDFASRMQRRVKDEAWTHQRRGEREPEPSSRRYSYADRDSGYYSEKSPAWNVSPSRRSKHRSITYPVPDPDQQSRGRAPEYRMIESRTRVSTSPSHRDSPRRRSSTRESSQSTVRPPRRSASSAGARGYELVRYESTAPSMPPFPATRPRRDSRGSEGYNTRRSVEVQRIEAPPSAFSEWRRTDAQRTSSRSRQAPGSSHSSTHTARRVPLPASVAPSAARFVSTHPSAPPSAASAALTARALSEKERVDGLGTGSQAGKLDDLRTVVPDDSISCAPTRVDYSERRERGSRTSRTRGRSSRYDDRPRSGAVMG